MELLELKSCWNEVLDTLEASNRISWLAFFDARLADFSNGTLTLDFSDATKFQDGHDLKSTVSKSSYDSLVGAIEEVTGLIVDLKVS
jgi:hypothetical protein